MADRNPASDFLQFTIGGCLFGSGVFLFLNQVMVRSDPYSRGLRWRWGSPRNPGIPPWNLSGNTGFPGLEAPGMGLVMLPLALGVCLLFAGVYQKWGRLLVWVSLAILFAGVLNTLRISFMPATLWQLTACVFMIASGGGLMFRGLSSYASLDAGINKRDAPGRSQDRPSSNDDTEAIRRELAKLKRRLDNRESS